MTSDRRQGTSHARLIRGVGSLGVGILVVNSVIGTGIFVMPAAVAEQAGLVSPWLFLLVGLLILTVVLTFAELASYFEDSGGPVLYTTAAFGPLMGFATGWILIISRMTAFAANSTIMALYLGEIWEWFEQPLGRSVLISAVCTLLTIANCVGVKDGVRTMSALTVFKLVPLILLIFLGLPYVTSNTLFPTSFPHIEDLGGLVLLLIYPFVGFESATIISGETKSPKSTMPRALVLTESGLAVFFFLTVLVYVSVLPSGGEGGLTLVDLGRVLMGPSGVVIITLAAVFSIAGNLSSIMLAVPRLTFALSEKGLLPEWFAHVHESFRTPSNSILLVGAFGLALALSGTFVWLAAASALTRLLTYILCIAALPVIRRRASCAERARAYRLPGGYTIPILAFGMCLWAAAQSDLLSWVVTGVLLMTGLMLYAVAARQTGVPLRNRKS